MANLLDSVHGYDESFWVAASDVDGIDEFVWIGDHKDIMNSLWAPMEPAHGRGDCAILLRYGINQLAVQDCFDDYLQPLCEI